jgi:hypothetical protein
MLLYYSNSFKHCFVVQAKLFFMFIVIITILCFDCLSIWQWREKSHFINLTLVYSNWYSSLDFNCQYYWLLNSESFWWSLREARGQSQVFIKNKTKQNKKTIKINSSHRFCYLWPMRWPCILVGEIKHTKNNQ